MAKPDWEAIESAYRAGVLSVRAIAKRYQVPESTLRKFAVRNAWQRDLTEKVAAATKDKVVRSAAVRTFSTKNTVRTDHDIIEQASDEALSVVLSHRVALAGWRQIANHLKAFLSSTVITEDNHAALARTLSAGVDAQLKLIKGERDAYGLNNETAPGAEKELAQWMKDLAEGNAHGIRSNAENKIS
ncbi:hypothetical protein [Candidatus Fukatsuia endosymbiont of Tuberolachnus salignus]|uniref:hypothetical protein n=1 Tax=Candidatus Fukatsuia endosymbiont of Tuberolachnus salignus TaxID=3077957 RepID=UPI00313EDC06